MGDTPIPDTSTHDTEMRNTETRFTGALEGIRIVDTSTGPVGGLATMVLADFGADVVKVEPPGGDRFRSMAGSPLWLRGKRSVVLDLHTAAGLRRLHHLVSHADVVVVGGPPDRAMRWGIDGAGAELLRDDIVHCSITGWGEHGPLSGLPGYTSAVAARAGRMLAFGGQIPRPGPVYAAVPVAVHAAAHGAVQGIVSALIARSRHGGPQRVATSLLQGLLPFDLVELLLVQLAERGDIEPIPSAATDMPTLNYHPVLAKDGTWIQCGNLLEHLFIAFLDSIGIYGDLLTDERFLDPPALWTPDAVEDARDRILLRVREKTSDEWMNIFFANGNVAAEPFRSPGQALQHLDLVGNGAVVDLMDGDHGPVRMVGAIATLSATPAVITRPGPVVGQHTDAVFAEIAGAPAKLAPTPPTRSSPAGRPLEGIVIVEFASVIAAPLGVSMLGDLGARVIRVEPIEGDSFRQLLANGVMTVKTTASKESICIDLKRPEGRSVAHALIAKADVLVHNYRPGVPERLGIGYRELHNEFPDLVWVAVNGYGPHGPGANRPATHPVAGAAMGGAGYQSGRALEHECVTLADIREIARQLMRANEPSPDPNTSVVVASSVLIGLLARERLGLSQAIHIDMLCANAHANSDAFLHYEGIPDRPAIDDGLFGTDVLHRLYEAAEGWVFLTVTTAGEWQRFREAAGCVELEHDAVTVDELVRVFSARPAGEWERVLSLAGVSCVQADSATPGQFFAHHEQVIANGFVPLARHARFGDVRRWGPLVTVGGLAAAYGPGVLAGEHTDALLEELGFDTEQIGGLYAAGLVSAEAPTGGFSSVR